jgi:hypothetical protein
VIANPVHKATSKAYQHISVIGLRWTSGFNVEILKEDYP